MSLNDKFTAYLQSYSDKNLTQLSDMLADDVTLRDWKISVSGKAAAMAETEKNFNSARTIDIEILNIYEAQGAVAGELRIVVDATEILYVVDVMTFDAAGKIKSIRAYLGRGD